MGSAGQSDRSLGSGISLPQWMKSKMDARFDFDDSTFSPPSHDDSFFHLRFSKNTQESKAKSSEEGFRPISEVLNESNTIAASNQVAAPQPPSQDITKIDFSKHPLPCQPFVPNAAQKVTETKPPKSAYAGKLKSQGIDDGFHGQPALCGKSIVHVANQMMSGKVTKGFSLENNQSEESVQNKNRNERSKSLPASPLASPMSTPDSSPKSRRKVIQSNRYFTGAFLPDKEKYQGGWILASILGQQREISTVKIEEEDESEEVISAPKNLIRKKSISSQNLTYIPKEELPAAPQLSNKNVYTKVFQAKPSELREMNFWSPTSM